MTDFQAVRRKLKYLSISYVMDMGLSMLDMGRRGISGFESHATSNSGAAGLCEVGWGIRSGRQDPAGRLSIPFWLKVPGVRDTSSRWVWMDL